MIQEKLLGPVDDYLAGLPATADRAELERLRPIIQRLVPDCGQGISYAMPCYLYRGKPVAALMVAKKHLSWYPYSGQVIRTVAELAEYSQSTGALHFSPSQPLSDSAVAALLTERMREIDEKLDTPKR